MLARKFFVKPFCLIFHPKVHTMDFGRVSSKYNRAITSLGLFQRMSATQRKVRSREDDALCFLIEKPLCVPGLY